MSNTPSRSIKPTFQEDADRLSELEAEDPTLTPLLAHATTVFARRISRRMGLQATQKQK